MSHIDVARRHLTELEQKLDAISLRERLLVAVTACSLILAFWFVLVFEPAANLAAEKLTRLESVNKRTAEANKNLEYQVLALAGGNAEQRSQLERVEHQIDLLNTTLANYASELVDPKEMAIVLEGVLRSRPELNLVRMRNLPSTTVAASDDEAATRFFRHGLEIELEGSYAGLLHYLEEIEDLPWRLYWQVLELETLDYPRNRIRIEVSTMSLDEGWIGA